MVGTPHAETRRLCIADAKAVGAPHSLRSQVIKRGVTVVQGASVLSSWNVIRGRGETNRVLYVAQQQAALYGMVAASYYPRSTRVVDPGCALQAGCP